MKKKKLIKKTSKGRVENPIHIMLTASESIEGKKDILKSEVSILKVSQSITNYKELRIQELQKKAMILKRFGEIKRNLTRLQKILPAVKVPKILEHENQYEEEEKISASKKITLSKGTGTVKSQLEEIQEKLRSLEEMQ